MTAKTSAATSAVFGPWQRRTIRNISSVEAIPASAAGSRNATFVGPSSAMESPCSQKKAGGLSASIVPSPNIVG